MSSGSTTIRYECLLVLLEIRNDDVAFKQLAGIQHLGQTFASA